MDTKTDTQRRFIQRFMFTMILFLGLIAVQTFTIELLDMPTWMVVIVTLLPILPLIWAFFIFRVRFLALDEYMQRLTGEAFLWTIGLVCFASFAYGMLAMKLPMPEVSFAYILPAVFGGHGIILRFLLMDHDSEK
ncbi:MAG: hypothetical protein ACI93R_002469 [Flavobacteriales bacterium]|jgi:hypothetical protein